MRSSWSGPWQARPVVTRSRFSDDGSPGSASPPTPPLVRRSQNFRRLETESLHRPGSGMSTLRIAGRASKASEGEGVWGGTQYSRRGRIRWRADPPTSGPAPRRPRAVARAAEAVGCSGAHSVQVAQALSRGRSLAARPLLASQAQSEAPTVLRLLERCSFAGCWATTGLCPRDPEEDSQEPEVCPCRQPMRAARRGCRPTTPPRSPQSRSRRSAAQRSALTTPCRRVSSGSMKPEDLKELSSAEWVTSESAI